MNTARPRIYLAGPDLFRPDAAIHFAKLAEACAARGLEALIPFEEEEAGEELTAHGVYERNMWMLRSAHGVAANLRSFRGCESDSGTAFEVGVAVALGLPVVAYGVPSGAYVKRVGGYMRLHRDAAGVLRDPDHLRVEDYDLPLNLMLSGSVVFADHADGAFHLLAQELIVPG